MDKKILIVDDEKNIVNIIKFNLEREGYTILTAFDGEDGLKKGLNPQIDLILLDVMMPKLDGFEVCRKIREQFQTPIIMITARAEETDKIFGLDIGCDDYITKPFSIKELIARVNANIRRSTGTNKLVDTGRSNIHTYGDIIVDLGKFDMYRDGNIINVTKREVEIIHFLASQKTKAFSREELLKNIWGYEYLGDVRTVDVTIRRLRTKIEKNPDEPEYILTKRGVGYYFNY